MKRTGLNHNGTYSSLRWVRFNLRIGYYNGSNSSSPCRVQDDPAGVGAAGNLENAKVACVTLAEWVAHLCPELQSWPALLARHAAAQSAAQVSACLLWHSNCALLALQYCQRQLSGPNIICSSSMLSLLMTHCWCCKPTRQQPFIPLITTAQSVFVARFVLEHSVDTPHSDFVVRKYEFAIPAGRQLPSKLGISWSDRACLCTS